LIVDRIKLTVLRETRERFFSPNFKVRNEPRDLGNPIRTIARCRAPRLSTARTSVPMTIIFGTSVTSPESTEEAGSRHYQSHPVQLLASILFLTRYRCLLRMTKAFGDRELARSSRVACLAFLLGQISDPQLQ